MRLIDADALIKTLEVANEELLELTGYETELCLYDVIQIIKDMPAIDSVKHGKWIYERYGGMWPADCPRPEQKCSLCGEWAYKDSNYCPNCGACMTVEDS